MTWHGYMMIEDVNLNDSQRRTLVNAIKMLGLPNDPQPARRNHWRIRLDNRALIFEAAFNENNLTITKFKNRLGNIFNIDLAAIDHSLQNVTYSLLQTPVITFSRGGTNYIRFAVFGSIGATWEQSGDECRAFLATNTAEWELSE